MLKELKSLTDWYKMNLTKPHLGCLKSFRAWQTDRWTSPSLTWAAWWAVEEDPGWGNIADAGNARRGGPEQEQELKIVHLLWMVSWEYMCNISIENHQQHYQYEQGHLFSISISWNVPQTIKSFVKSYVKREVQGSDLHQLKCLKLVSSINTMEWPWHWDCRGCFTSRPWIHSEPGLPFSLRLLSDQRSSEVTSGVTIFLLSPLLYTGKQGPALPSM